MIPSVMVVAQMIIAQPNIYFKEQKMFGRFLRLTSPRIFRAPIEDEYEFLTMFEDRLCCLCLAETHRVDYTAFWMDLIARYWWIGYLYSRKAGFLVLT